MYLWLILIGILILVITVIIIIIWLLQCPKYNKIIDVSNLDQLKQHFLLDNPNGDGSDPTQGWVDYSYCFDRDSTGKLIPNVNGDTTWQEIGNTAILNTAGKNALISNYENGIKLDTSPNLTYFTENFSAAGAVRLISRKLFKGGLFIFDIEHCPYGCTVWPAVWLNGFIGVKDQYHAKPGTDIYNQGIKKLANSTLSESFSKVCNQPLNPAGKPDPFLSAYANKPIYVAMWPTGGEVDILEQTNFSHTNLISIHSGPKCEVSSDYGQNFMIDTSGDYKDTNIRSACGQTWAPFGPYSGCLDPEYKICPSPTGTIDYSSGSIYPIPGEPAYIPCLPSETRSVTKLSDSSVRSNCPYQSAMSAGNTQTVLQPGSFGELFNRYGGGVYACQWIPKKKVYIWFWPRRQFDTTYLSKNSGPLSNSPNPDAWEEKVVPSIKGSPGDDTKLKILVASYNLDANNAMTDGCDFNFQSIVINTTLGGGFGGGNMADFCLQGQGGNKGNWTEYIQTCYNASPDRANVNTTSPGVDPVTNCFDGGMSSNYRGANASAVFFTEAYFKFRKIRVFQTNKDDNVW